MVDAEISLLNLDLSRFYRIYNNVHEMLGARDYEPLEKKLKRKAFISRYLGYMAELQDDSNDIDAFGVIDQLTLLFKRKKTQLLVYFLPLETKLAQNDMDYIINTLMVEKNAQHLVIVANSKATPKVSSVLGILGSRAQLFTENELLTNITKHQFVPKHVLVSGDEQKRVLDEFAKLPGDDEYHLDVFPGMFTEDAVAKYYNFQLDDLVRIERVRKDGFVDISYRVVTLPMTDKEKK
jgi:DNA-directed RNA polymerases I, II, and III subunit RPABC1